MVNLIYPRVVSQRRRAASVGAGAGAGSYDGLQRSQETVVARNLPCNIQIDRTGRPSDAKLPGDPIGEPTHKLFFPASAAPTFSSILERDVFEDEIGRRFQAIAVEWQPLACQVRAQLLET
jgi:hypothetical protein